MIKEKHRGTKVVVSYAAVRKDDVKRLHVHKLFFFIL
jgi:hypothetical protein